MIALFSQAPVSSREHNTQDQDPRTSFREVQAQDVVVWGRVIYDSFLERITNDPNDKEALDWFLSNNVDGGSFIACCRMFGMDGDDLRQQIKTLVNRGRS